jgi:glyoxylase-like metal-dependent hydrolase (beta-lactamase superfamily II)
MRPIDVVHVGTERVICCWEVDGFLVDPGPESSVETLLERLGDGFEPRGVLATHIHFDHAGASGRLVERWPDLPVYVHEVGARHMIDPERLVSSARRLYGDDFDRLWGEVVPVPEKNVRVLQGGETVEGFRVEYTPGHASHHVAYLHEDSGWAYVGDVAGVRIEPSSFVVAPTPPPDVDVEAWNASIDVVAGWKPTALGLTHFGKVDKDVDGHLAALRDQLDEQARMARAMSREDFVTSLTAQIRDAAGDELTPSFVQAAPPDQLFQGLDRYWRKRAEREAA